MKRVIFAMAVAFAALSSQAAYLYWQVSDAAMQNDEYLHNATSDNNYQYYARLHYGTDTSQYALWDAWEDTTGDTLNALGGDGTAADAIAVNLSTLASDPTPYSFYIEIVQYQGGSQVASVAKSEIQSYSTLAGQNYIVDFDRINLVQVWTGGAYSVPEPTSAALLLVGVAFLGLRRRRA